MSAAPPAATTATASTATATPATATPATAATATATATAATATVSGTTAAPTEVRGLAPRPPTDPAVVAVLAAAVDQAWPRPVVAPPVERSTSPAWRFSGRWWTKPTAARRDRPWARG